MPLLNIYTSAETLSTEASSALLTDLSATLARLLGKPEKYVMTCLVPQTRMTFAGTTAPACYAELKNIGELSSELTTVLSAELCAKLARGLGVSMARTYVEFTVCKPHLWGFNGETFA